MRVEPRLEKQYARLQARVKDELKAMQLSAKVEQAVIGKMKHLLAEYRRAQSIIEDYEASTGRSRSQLLREARETEDRHHLPKIKGENLLDIAMRIRAAQQQIREIERCVSATGNQLARKLDVIEAGQAKSHQAKKELTEANLRLVVSLGRRYNTAGWASWT